MFDLAPVDPARLPRLMALDEAPGLYADALLTDERDGLLFISLWGRDTAVQELLARMTLSPEEGGIRSLRLSTADGPQTVHLDRMACMDKHSGRMPPRNLFGNLVQLWIHDRLAVEPDRANRRALLLYRPEADAQDAIDTRLWTLVREVCHLPLLATWREPVLALLENSGWLQPLSGRSIAGWRLELGDPAFETAITQLIRKGVLQLDGGGASAAVDTGCRLAA
ncbi:MAG: hypothetical protein VX836_12275 [Pseudomonadota bacterium]|nr:hypothetical protein [Pseudomonadota bacterium]